MGERKPRTWLVTGVSSGLGRAIAEQVLARGDVVVGTVRSSADRVAFETLAPGRSHCRIFDLAKYDAITGIVDDIERTVGPIDVLVNNAGYLHQGAIEEASLEEMRLQFDANVLGTLAVTKAVLPSMRARRAGHIMIMSSQTAYITAPGLGLYCMSKAALMAAGEALATEVSVFGIRVSVLAPGGFRTDATGRSMKHVSRAINDYDPLMEHAVAFLAERHGMEGGDPQKLGAALVDLEDSGESRLHFLLGSDAIANVGAKLDALQEEIKKWEHLSVMTDIEG